MKNKYNLHTSSIWENNKKRKKQKLAIVYSTVFCFIRFCLVFRIISQCNSPWPSGSKVATTGWIAFVGLCSVCELCWEFINKTPSRARQKSDTFRPAASSNWRKNQVHKNKRTGMLNDGFGRKERNA